MLTLNQEQKEMLAGEKGVAKQMAMRLTLDLAAITQAEELVPISSAHLSGVSPLTGGLGLRRFLAKLAEDPQAKVAVQTTLNSAGCDESQFEAMGIVAPDFLAQNHEIVAHYTALGVLPTQSCIPYEWEGVKTEGVAAWAESNAICYGNSYCGLITNRDSGLSALAAALTGYTPRYGLLIEGAVRPNLLVHVTTPLLDPTDFSLLGDWIGAQRQPHWKTPYGPIPVIQGLPDELTHEQRKALTAAAANYGSPKLYINDSSWDDLAFQATLTFSAETVAELYAKYQPKSQPTLIVLGCPQASVGELRAIAQLLQGKRVLSADAPHPTPILWVFTSSANKAIAEKLGLAQIITQSGALLLADTCPEVVPYNPAWVKHILTNSMKAEHYIKSGLNGIPTSVMRLADCIAIATGERQLTWDSAESPTKIAPKPKKISMLSTTSSQPVAEAFVSQGKGLPSQTNFRIEGEAFVTNAPITFLGYVNRETGVIEEEGHPMNGQSLAGKIAIFPKGSGSSVAPYVLLELFYRGKAPIAIINTEIDQQCAPACSLEHLPYAYGFDRELIGTVKNGDRVVLEKSAETVTFHVLPPA